IVINHGELAERAIAIGFGRIRPESAGWEASLVWPGDDGVQVCGYDIEVGIEHAELVVIQQRLAACRSAGLCCRHISRSNLRAIPLSAFRFNVDAAEQS